MKRKNGRQAPDKPLKPLRAVVQPLDKGPFCAIIVSCATVANATIFCAKKNLLQKAGFFAENIIPQKSIGNKTCLFLRKGLK
ncbi:MAG: hypothetical protein IJ306_10560 [Oscillospiraceae bacterium]|nr:hypothetical protein [Oscillospiraceae bacterium]